MAEDEETPPSITRAIVDVPPTGSGGDGSEAELTDDGASLEPIPVPIPQLAHYQVLGELGRGGMGIVYEAYDARLDRKVAIKQLLTPSQGSQKSRFIREAMAMAKLSHPNVIPIYEIREQDDAAYIVMEYVEGTTLRAWQTRPRSLAEILEVFKGAARGLIAAHEKMLVHRDFKPDNVLIGKDGRVRVMDFGLARAAHEIDVDDSDEEIVEVGNTDMMSPFDPLTKPGMLLGTPPYMSPEQHRGSSAGPASDQFSFCVALYEALYGERPFVGANLVELRDNVEAGRISEPKSDTMVPGWLRELVLRGLAPKPEDRAESMQAWLDALLAGERAHASEVRKPAGFRADRAREIWQRLIAPVANGKVVPIIGPRLLEDVHGGAHKTAMLLADAKHYPMALHEWDDLPRVTAYLNVKESRYNVVQAFQDQLLRNLLATHGSWLPPEEIPPAVKKPKLGKLLALVGDRLRDRTDDPYRILANLPASIYVTTNFDPLLERAIKANDRTPQQVVTRWRHKRAPVSIAESFEEPSVSTPLVYHVFGAFGPDAENGLVLTEDDHFDYLISNVSARLLPPEVESALVNNSLLFLGFRLTDWHFRVLFRVMMNLPGRDRLKNYCHVAVQVDPDLQSMADVEGAKSYLAEYFGQEANVDIYWGSSEEFLIALRDELATAEGNFGEPSKGTDDEWSF